MAYKFNDEDKEVAEFSERIPYGVSKVQLIGVTAGETDAGKEFIEVTVTDKDGFEDSARVWFVGGASKFSFNTLRQIVVHSAKSEEDKEKARMAVEKCDDVEDLATLINKKCTGCELWFTKYLDPERTYIGTDGITRRSINKSIYGYEPRLKPELLPTAARQQALATDVQDSPLGGEAATGDAAKNIPEDWA